MGPTSRPLIASGQWSQTTTDFSQPADCLSRAIQTDRLDESYKITLKENKIGFGIRADGHGCDGLGDRSGALS